MNKLQEIINHKRIEVENRKREIPVPSLKMRPPYSRQTRSLIESIRSAGNGFGIIAEFKRKSPSAGVIRDDIDPVDAALEYIKNGAAGVSVLTDEKYFGGSPDDLEQVSRAVNVPVLQKDFILDEYQLYEAKAYGADAVLLIADVLSKNELHYLFDQAVKIGLECLVELYDEPAVEKIDFDTMKLIGINNRDLRTFSVDINHTKNMIQKLPADILVVSESGLHSSDDIESVKRFGAQGALIGEWFMKGVKSNRNGKPLIKICGITNANDALAAAELGAGALGFIFSEKSPRYIAPERAAAIIKLLPEDVLPAGVFVNHNRSEIERIIDTTAVEIIQLHGDESPGDCNFTPAQVWKVIRPRNGTDIEILDAYTVDAFLFDTFDKTRYGGTGKTGNWEIARAAAEKYNVILSGGLHAGNIIDAISTVRPYGVDINSGVESEPGKKDIQQLEKLFQIMYDTQIGVKA